ncbi:hypothetical protein XA3_01630 [Xylocopilactobacillus apicola]|uniref:YfhO family protein n=1 Tax=Xylocopilactobacillus apicola TaxID=2932184 RepID=A0AAU9DA65_9LACO|nr:hypothetical protein XA3_01630 [Xylocopilactobacillus apicola]
MIWSGDGIAQHYPALVRFHHDLQELIFCGKSISLWQWNIGLGQDYLQTFSYYVLGDVLLYPAVLFPASFLPDYYSIMVIVRLYLAGLAFIFAVRRLVKARDFTLGLGGIVYVFSGYTAYSSFAHPFFLNPLILFPILIVQLQRVLKQKSVLPWIGIVALTLFVNFYFAYILALGTAVYWIVALIRHREYRRWQNMFRVVAGAAVGFLISAALFLPSLYFLLNSARTDGKMANGLKIYPLSYYLSLPGRMLVPQGKSAFWLMGGLMILGLLGVIFVLRRARTYQTLTIIFCLSGLGLLLPFFASVLNGFSSPSNRWLLLVQLPLGIAAVLLLEHLSELVKADYLIFVIFGGVICVSLLVISAFGRYDGDLGLLTFQYLLTVIALLSVKKNRNQILTVLTVINAITIFACIEPYNISATNRLLSRQAVQELTKRQAGYEKKVVNDYQIDPKNRDADQPTFSRAYIDTQLPKYTYHPSLPILSDLNSLETYWSLESNDVYKLMHELGVSNSIQNDVTGNADLRNILLNYLGVSEIMLNEDAKIIPASFQNYNSEIYNGQQTYLSDSSFPLFYFPEYLISNKDFTKMTPTQKEASLLDSVALTQGQDQSKMAAKVQNVPFYNKTILYSKGQHVSFTTQTPEQLKLQSPSGQVVLLMAADPELKDQELHLEFSNINYDPFNFGQLWQADLTDYQAEHENDQLKGADDFQDFNVNGYRNRWLARNYLKIGRATPGYELSATYLDRTDSFRQLSAERLSGYEVRKNVSLNLGPVDQTDHEQWILLNTDVMAHFSFDLKLTTLPTGEEITKTAKKVRKVSRDNLDFKIGQDKIDLKVKHPVKKVVATTIPYSPGWRIDHGKIVKLNGTFIGIELDQGQREYQLRYRTPFLDLGLKLSALGVMVALVWAGAAKILKKFAFF